MTADALVSRHTSAWQAATVHPFLAGVRDGSLPEHSFDRWLAQDYLFAQALVRAQSRIAATAPLADVMTARSAIKCPFRSRVLTRSLSHGRRKTAAAFQNPKRRPVALC